MDAGRFIKVFEQIRKWEWWEDSICVHLFIYMMLEAKPNNSTFRGERIKRGEFVAGRGKISLDTGISEAQVRTRMKRLRDSGEISWRTIVTDERKHTVVTIKNYSKFQAVEKPKEKTEYMKQLELLKRNEYSAPFKMFFHAYKKGAIGSAWVAWQKTHNKPTVEEIVKTVEAYKAYCADVDRPLMDAQGWISQRYFDSIWTHEEQGTEPSGAMTLKETVSWGQN